MTEYDYSPAAIEQHKRTQNRIANWRDDADRHSPQFRSPFVPRSDVQDNEFHHPRSSSSSRRHTPSPSHSSSRSHSSNGRRTPQRSQTHHPPPTQPHVRSPLRSATISVVTPNDSISQVGSGGSHRHHHRSHSSSPTRHSSSHRSRGTTYVVSPGMQYVQAPQPMAYAVQPQQQQPAAYIVHARKVQVVYPDQTQQVYHNQYPPAPHPVQEHHASFLQRLFGSQSGKRSHARSKSVGHSSSRSSRR
ncbi:hypothetical protein FB45DRAFT_1064710 [Roridomyces roridus]|uniref:Uncharacterized protein n=1 Tax=Roridomyces roridus TaxID=1738132 RepID=A0AAD7BA69_9AGAR|nr:hypothetical protein FB45DRAFT_1064710 [Roridomyces roridus]